MPTTTFEWNGAVFETRPLKTKDTLRIQYLQSNLGIPGDTESYFFASEFAEFIVGTRIISGDPGFSIPKTKAPTSELRAAMDAWLDTEHLWDKWAMAKVRVNRIAREEESPNPESGGTTETGATAGENSSDEPMNSYEASPDPLSA